MGKTFEAITPELAAWIGRQQLFFVATAPSGWDGHVNLSPKGPIESLRVLDERTVAYLGPGALEAYKAEKNTASIDGLPAIA